MILKWNLRFRDFTSPVSINTYFSQNGDAVPPSTQNAFPYFTQSTSNDSTQSEELVVYSDEGHDNEVLSIDIESATAEQEAITVMANLRTLARRQGRTLASLLRTTPFLNRSV